MNNYKFSEFILFFRKEKRWTQLEMAEELNVTEKVVSRWEQGIGLPDIKTMESLAKIFNASIIDSMCSERTSQQPISVKNATEVIRSMMDIFIYQRKIERERKNILIIILSITTFVMLVFLIDTMLLSGFIMVCLPIILSGTGICLICFSIHRARQKLPYLTMRIIGILALLCPVYEYIFLCFGWLIWSAPYPS